MSKKKKGVKIENIIINFVKNKKIIKTKNYGKIMWL